MNRPGTRVVLLCSLLIGVLFVSACARTPQQKYARFLDRGKKLLEKSDPAKALIEFRSAIQEQPNEAEVYYWVAQAFLQQNNVGSAVSALRRATELNPHLSAAQLKLAELMIRSHDEQLLKDAEARIQKILTDTPGDQDALFTLAATEAQQGKSADAEKYLNEVLERSPADLRSKMALALLKVAQKDQAGAEQVLKQAIQQAPNSDDAVIALATLYVQMGRLSDAEPLFAKGVQLNPKNSDAWVSLGSLQLKAHKLNEAEESFKRAAAVPNTTAPLAYVVFLIRQDRREQAIGRLEEMFKADQNNRIVRSALVAGYLTANRQPDAVKILDSTLEKNPRDLEALLQRSQILFRERSFDEALVKIERALAVSSTSAQAHFLRSKIYWAKGDDVKRMDDLAATLKYAPDSLPARFDMADALLKANQPKQALHVLDEARDDQKRTVDFAVAYNWALINMGNVSEARKAVDRALGTYDNPELKVQDALLKYASRDLAGARISLEQALRVKPDNEQALKLLADTYAAQYPGASATEKIRQLVQQQPNSLSMQLLWARWLIRVDQKVEARKVLASLIASNQKSTEPLLVSAGLDFRDHNLASARSTLKELVRLDEKNLPAYLLAGEVEEASGNYGDAATQYRKALSLDPGNILALNNLAYVLSRDSSHIEEALSFARRAKEQFPESPEILDTLGWLYYRKGLYDSAAQTLEQALSKAEWPAIQYHLGLTYNRLGQTVKGGRLLATALTKDPELADDQSR